MLPRGPCRVPKPSHAPAGAHKIHPHVPSTAVDRKISRKPGWHQINRAKSWTFQRFRAAIDLEGHTQGEAPAGRRLEDLELAGVSRELTRATYACACAVDTRGPGYLRGAAAHQTVCGGTGPGERGVVGLGSPGPQADRGFRRCQSSDLEKTRGDHVTNGPTNSWLSLCVLS